MVTLVALALSGAPAFAAAKVANNENLPIPEGSATPTSLSGGAGGTLLRLGLGLIVVVGLIAAVWYVMKRVQRSRFPGLDERGPSLIDIVATTALGPGRSLHLVRVGEEIVLVGSTEHSITPIVRIGADDAVGLGESVRPQAGVDPDRARAVATATDDSLVERLRALTMRR